jgi:hypothetical protein
LITSITTSAVSIVLAGKPFTEPRKIEKKVFIHYKKGYGKPEGTPGGGKPKDKQEGYYDFLARGAKWKTTNIELVYNDLYIGGLDEGFFISSITLAMDEWDKYSVTELFGDLRETNDYVSLDTDVRDYTNELVFSDYPEEGVIAVAYVWGIWGGPPRSREIVEFDIMFDTDYTWGDAGIDDSLMDLQNIATHEIGHGLGLADLYESAANLETMYGYSSPGDTIKRTLYLGDIAGIQELYG